MDKPTFSLSPTLHSRTCFRFSRSRGFSLAEIVVVIAIIGVIFGVVVAGYKNFDSTSILKNLSYEVALSVREAQVMTISTSNLGGGNILQNQGQNSYGINFTAGSNAYEIFSDANSNKIYDGSGELIKLITMSQGSKIGTLNEKRSGSGATLFPITTATITFVRPHLDTTFVTSSNSNIVTEVQATVQSARGAARTVRILKSGRIQVQ